MLVSTHRKKIPDQIESFSTNKSKSESNKSNQPKNGLRRPAPVQLNEWLCWSPYGDSLGFLVPSTKAGSSFTEEGGRHSGESTTCISLGIQSYSQMMIGMSNHLLSIVFRFHYHCQEVIGSLGYTGNKSVQACLETYHFGVNFSPGSYRFPTHLIVKSSCCALNMDSTVDIMKS